MRGLVLNNLYLIINNLKVSFAINFMCLALYAIFPNQVMLFAFIFIILILLPCSSLNAIAVSRSSRWYHLEKIMPFNEKMLVLSRYTTYFILSILCLLLLVVFSIVQNALGETNFGEIIIKIRGLQTFTVNEMIKTYFFQSHLICALYFPLIYFFKTDKMDVVILVSVGASLPIVFFVMSWNVLWLVLFAVGFYVISFVLSCLLVEHEKESF